MATMTLVQVDEDVLASEEAMVGAPTLPLDFGEPLAAPMSLIDTPDHTVSEETSPVIVPTPKHKVELRRLTVGDVDRLWDWIRADGPACMAEWGVDSSVSLHQNMQYLDELSNQGRCAVYAGYVDDEHIGQVSIAPLLATQGVLHIFLAQSVRGPRGVSILRHGLATVEALHPDIELLAMTNDRRLARLMNRIGLGHTQYILTKGAT